MDANWWHFDIVAPERHQKIGEDPRVGCVEVNGRIQGGRHTLDYASYLGLDSLLGSQLPSSRVPDERVFIVTHQLFELVFKQMLFDLAVVAETLRRLRAEQDDARFSALCTTCGATDRRQFWQAALTAAGRIRYSTDVILPRFFGYLTGPKDREETFEPEEFRAFREYLPPASGFQSAQFRLIQRAFGKAGLLGLSIFPAQTYRKEYEGHDDPGFVAVESELVLRDALKVSNPSPPSPLARVADLDEIAHAVLMRLSRAGTRRALGAVPLPPVDEGTPRKVAEAFKRSVGERRQQRDEMVLTLTDAQEAAARQLETDLDSFLDAENRRRASLGPARAAAIELHHAAGESFLLQVLERLVLADDDLHLAHADGFLTRHHALAAYHLSPRKELGENQPLAGSGGGGLSYLNFVRLELVPLFPALVACRNLHETPRWSFVD